MQKKQKWQKIKAADTPARCRRATNHQIAASIRGQRCITALSVFWKATTAVHGHTRPDTVHMPPIYLLCRSQCNPKLTIKSLHQVRVGGQRCIVMPRVNESREQIWGEEALEHLCGWWWWWWVAVVAVVAVVGGVVVALLSAHTPTLSHAHAHTHTRAWAHTHAHTVTHTHTHAHTHTLRLRSMENRKRSARNT